MMNNTAFPNLSRQSFDVDADASVIRSPVLDKFLWLSHGVTTRQFAPPETETFDLVAQVRRRLAPGGSRIFCCEQVHGSRIEVVESAKRYAGTDRAQTRGPVVQLLGADGLVATAPLLPICVRTADCVPLLLADVRQRRVAAIHAGWRGSLERIAEKTVAAMVRQGSDADDLAAWMGPAISGEAYEVGPELAERFRATFPEYKGIVSNNHLDLILLNACQLCAAGVPAAQIHAANLCTAQRLDLCCSYRAERGSGGRMIAYAMILPTGRVADD
jgi:hypothetical protein